ncbi:MAG: metallophosphoesterase [Bacteroidaceae bacterium]|nr:metallophosphoesterase [Bacteroidaceae bacterium]
MFFFLRIAAVLMLLLVLPALYLHFRYLRRKDGMRRWRILMWTATAILAAGTLWYISYGFQTGRPEWLTRLFIHLLLGVSFAQVGLSIGGLLATLTKRNSFMRRAMTGVGIGLAALSLIITIMAYFIGNKRIEVKEYTFASKELPEAFDGFRIVHISDLHLGTYGADTARVSELINKTLEQKGDIILFTGDLVNLESREALPFVEQLKRLTAPYGVYSILGNHDYAVYRNFAEKDEQLADIEQLVKLEKECGWHVMRNENAIIEKDSARIALIGVENDGKPPFPQLANIPKAIKGLPTDANFKIMMTHDPSHWRRNVLSETDAQLTLAGHTHGMQFKLAGWSPASWVYKEWGGQYYEGDRSIVVSIGLGLGAVPFRFGAWSEVCVITLERCKM